MTRSSRLAGASTAIALALSAAACADTVVDEPDDAAELAAGTGDQADADASTTTVTIVGTAAELLPALATEMSLLSAQVAGDGDETATMAHIDALWVAARPEVESNRPELTGPIDSTVEMARVAVVRVRPADADKAFSLLTGLVDDYTGDG